MSDEEHARALERTGYWGRRAAGVMFLASSSGRIGLALRSGGVLQPFTYGVVGGAIDPRENPQVAAAREVKEEIGITLNPLALIPLDVFKDKGFQYLTFLAVVPEEFNPPFLNWESSAYEWFALEALPRNLHPGVATTLAKTKVQAQLRRSFLRNRGLGATLGRRS
jgi:8-oxo-dGTP pyrophosphatase MutT (NUDIX family)